MRLKTHFTYNPWFLLPFLVWMIAGGILLANYNAQQLFSAVNTRHTALLDTIMYRFTDLGDGMPITIIVSLIFLLLPGFRNWWFLLAAVLCNVVPALIIQVIKEIYHAPRPLAVYKDQTWVHILSNWRMLYDNSFPSGHTAGAFSLFCFLSVLLPRRLAAVGLLFFTMALMVGYSRMYLAAHFFKDVYVGSLIGTIVTMAMYQIERDLHGRFFRTGSEKEAAR